MGALLAVLESFVLPNAQSLYAQPCSCIYQGVSQGFLACRRRSHGHARMRSLDLKVVGLKRELAASWSELKALGTVKEDAHKANVVRRG